MAAKTYSEKLKDPRWQKKRLEILQRDEWQCKLCRDKENTLMVHHIAYNGEPWEAEDHCLITLCESCHQSEHDRQPEYEKLLIDTLKLQGYLSDDFREIALIFHRLGVAQPNSCSFITSLSFLFSLHEDEFRTYSKHIATRPPVDFNAE